MDYFCCFVQLSKHYIIWFSCYISGNKTLTAAKQDSTPRSPGHLH